jgi:hypothetical protein
MNGRGHGRNLGQGARLPAGEGPSDESGAAGVVWHGERGFVKVDKYIVYLVSVDR